MLNIGGEGINSDKKRFLFLLFSNKRYLFCRRLGAIAPNLSMCLCLIEKGFNDSHLK